MTTEHIPNAPEFSWGSLEASLRLSLAQAPWVSAADAGAVELAVYLARLLDDPELQLRDKGNTAKIYAAILRELGLTVAGRSDKPEAKNEEVTPLDEIRKQSALRLNNAPRTLKITKG